jgi:hypothetical protein
MSFMLVSLQRVKDALRITTSDDDATLEIYISAASLAVVEYLKAEAGDFIGINSPPDSPPDDLTTVDERVVLAVMVMVKYMFDPQSEDAIEKVKHGYLPPIAEMVLYAKRIPTLA